ncbi:protein CUP-SHAPED COTYLEDON 3-like [Typha angustifolia]|uniref:protein CUP-SHAPED COTYLEDON 3-like n=1 Tax=Typha angustifolia TaxID=59011 RepID=UPI003C2BB44F
MDLRDINGTLLPGFRFYPSDEELVCYYLRKKVANERAHGATMVEVDLHTREPWELPDVAKLSANEWYFFSFRDRKYATGLRTNRATKSGYWKATGKDRIIHDPSSRMVTGMRKTLVFYRGRAPNGIKSSWVMHEFRLENPHTPPKEDWVLCRVFQKKRGESMNNNYNMEIYEPESNAIGCSSSHLDSSTFPNDQPMSEQLDSSFSTAPHQESNSSNSDFFFNLPLLHQNFLDFPQDVDGAAMSGNGDDYGILLSDMRDFTRFQGGKDQVFF